MSLIPASYNQQMTPAEWEKYVSIAQQDIRNERTTCREWTAVANAVRQKDGLDATSNASTTSVADRVSYRHYISYSTIREALRIYLALDVYEDGTSPTTTIREAGIRLEAAILRLFWRDLYTPFSAASQLRPPGLCSHCRTSSTVSVPGLVVDRRKEWRCVHWRSAEERREEKFTTNYLKWAIQIICDYPDNIYYGLGTGDVRGDLPDVPVGRTQNDAALVRSQSGRVANAARRLMEVLASVDAGTDHDSLDIWSHLIDQRGLPRLPKEEKLQNGNMFMDEFMTLADPLILPYETGYQELCCYRIWCELLGRAPWGPAFDRYTQFYGNFFPLLRTRLEVTAKECHDQLRRRFVKDINAYESWSEERGLKTSPERMQCYFQGAWGLPSRSAEQIWRV